MAAILPLLRTITFGTFSMEGLHVPILTNVRPASTLVFSVIVLGLAADILNTTTEFDFYFTWSAFSIAVSVITILSLVPM